MSPTFREAKVETRILMAETRLTFPERRRSEGGGCDSRRFGRSCICSCGSVWLVTERTALPRDRSERERRSFRALRVGAGARVQLKLRWGSGSERGAHGVADLPEDGVGSGTEQPAVHVGHRGHRLLEQPGACRRELDGGSGSGARGVVPDEPRAG